MKLRRTSLGSIGFAIFICAVDLAVLRAVGLSVGGGAFAADGSETMQFVLLLLPMIDLLLVRLYRLHQSRRRSVGTVGFCVAGTLATAAVVAAPVVAADSTFGVLRAYCEVVVLPTIDALAQHLDDATLQSPPLQLAIAIAFQFLLPSVLLCLPPFAVACIGGWGGRRLGAARRDTDDAQSEPGPPILAGPAC